MLQYDALELLNYLQRSNDELMEEQEIMLEDCWNTVRALEASGHPGAVDLRRTMEETVKMVAELTKRALAEKI